MKAFQYQIGRVESTHKSNIIQTKQIIFRNAYVCICICMCICIYIYVCIYIYIYMHVATINEKLVHEFKWEKGGEIRQFRKERGRGYGMIITSQKVREAIFKKLK